MEWDSRSQTAAIVFMPCKTDCTGTLDIWDIWDIWMHGPRRNDDFNFPATKPALPPDLQPDGSKTSPTTYVENRALPRADLLPLHRFPRLSGSTVASVLRHVSTALVTRPPGPPILGIANRRATQDFEGKEQTSTTLAHPASPENTTNRKMLDNSRRHASHAFQSMTRY
ncbi:hypothetical protein PG997_006326 [Apiospora hydei]|uniref:Uncharacterized protein n=1 Tax=Apiospora hydei TaxID=1337664 RepID=A0ABR1WRD2_9PEZI